MPKAAWCAAPTPPRATTSTCPRRLTPRQAVTLAAMLRNPQREAARWAQEGSVDRDRLAWIAQQVRGVPVRQRRALVAQLQPDSSPQAVTSVPADRTAMIADGL